MAPKPLLVRFAASSFVLGILASGILAQGRAGSAPATRPAVNREQMWYAPTAEDWKKPCLIQWQRTYEDALAVSRETGKPVLVCVNMDGEIASEHYAGVRYRQPEIAKLYEPYVCVIASVYRHTPRDYDEQGRRVPCPRFGTVTCGEHIAIEPRLFDKYFESQRVAPRHIGVELDDKEMFDVFYAWDTDTIFNSLRDGIANRAAKPLPHVPGDRPVLERVGSRDSLDRAAVEEAFQNGDRDQRRAILDATIAQGEGASLEVVRLAMRGLDADLARTARRGLAKTNQEGAIDLLLEALRNPTDSAEREALIAALARLGEKSPRARTLAAVHQGLAGAASAVDVDRWSKALATAEPAPALVSDPDALESRLAAQTKLSAERASDADARLALAEATLEYAMNLRTARRNARVLFQDAERAALEAEKLGAYGWRLNAALALAASATGETAEAQARAEAAVAAMPEDARGWSSMAVLALFADARQQAISKALREKAPWPSQWIADVHAAYSVLARHPFGTDGQVAAHYDFLRRLGAFGQANRALDAGLARFPDSWVLHERLRARSLEERGVDGLEATYAAMLREKGESPSIEWFAGYASFVAAEFRRRAGKTEEALAAYDRALAHYDRVAAAQPESRANADHYAALALAARARIAFERGDDDGALGLLIASFARNPEAAASEDGLAQTPISTAQLLRSRLQERGRAEALAQLDAAIAKLDPRVLLPPPSEEGGVPSPDARRSRGGARRR